MRLPPIFISKKYMKLLILSFVLICLPVLAAEKYPPLEKKKILVLSSNGGYGHKAAEASLQLVLGKNYEIKTIYPIEEIKMWGVSGSEEVYNHLLKEGWILSTNIISKHIAPKLFRNRRRAIERLIDRHIEFDKPNIVISLIPFINYPATEAARKRDVPYLLITTDNDLRNWVHGLQSVTHPHFKVTVGSDLPSTCGLLAKRHIPEEAISVIGLPLRSSFKSSKNIEELYQEYDIPKQKPVVLIMMGGSGGNKCLEYTHAIGALPLALHLIVCTGKNDKLAQKLKEIKLHGSNSMTIVGFTNEVAGLMALSDVMVTKPGPGVINEAIATRLPLLIDKTSSSLSWERANITLVLKYGIGDPITDLRDLPKLLNQYLFDPTFRKHLNAAFDHIPTNEFNEKIRTLIDSMCSIPYPNSNK
jgi:UDP-N-acetylglucosamine:LPS N-acetylglucosamine transferase